MFSCRRRKKVKQLLDQIIEGNLREEDSLPRRGLFRSIFGRSGGDEEPRRLLDTACDLRPLLESMLKKLDQSDLEILLQAIGKSRGGEVSDCVLVPREPLGSGTARTLPHLLCCRLWRWPDLPTGLGPGLQTVPMKRLHWCRSSGETGHVVCLNPFHYSRLLRPDSPPPPYSRYPQDLTHTHVNRTHANAMAGAKIQMHRQAVAGPDGLTSCTGPTDPESPPVSSEEWCILKYWERKERFGEIFSVSKRSIDVFSNLPKGNGFCLNNLVLKDHCEESARTRQKIGFGISIAREENGVWVYNRSDIPVFLNSYTLDPPDVNNLTVYKLFPGFSIKMYDFEVASRYRPLRRRTPCFPGEESEDEPSSPLKPYNPFDSVRISFAKGWGPGYTRLEVLQCPCWLEVHFKVSR